MALGFFSRRSRDHEYDKALKRTACFEHDLENGALAIHDASRWHHPMWSWRCQSCGKQLAVLFRLNGKTAISTIRPITDEEAEYIKSKLDHLDVPGRSVVGYWHEEEPTTHIEGDGYGVFEHDGTLIAIAMSRKYAETIAVALDGAVRYMTINETRETNE